MGRRDEALADELMRSYNYVRRFVGVLWGDEQGPAVLSRPEFPEARFAELTSKLLSDTQPTVADMAEAIGAREIFSINAGHLGKGWFHLRALEGRDVQRLIDDGVRPLRSLRGRDFADVLATLRGALEAAQRPIGEAGDLDERLTRLFGADGRRVASRFERAVAAPGEDYRTRRLKDFFETAERVACDMGPPRPDLRELWSELADLPSDPVAMARALVGQFRDFAGGEEPRMLGRRRTLEARIRGLPLVPAVRLLVEVVDTESEPRSDGDVWTRRQKEQLLELALLTLDTSLELPRDPERVEALAHVLRGRQHAERATMWLGLRDVKTADIVRHRHTLRQAGLPVAELTRALKLGALATIWAFENGRGFGAYLDVLEHLRTHPITGINPADDWFVRPFTSGISWEPALMLGLIANHRKSPEVLVATLSALRKSELADFRIAEAFAHWDRPELDHRPPEFDAVGDALNTTVTELERYVHWRRLVGYDSDFSESVLKPLRLADREERELAHLESLEQTDNIAARVAALRDPERRSARLESAARRARNAFDRALEVLRRESLQAVIDAVTRATLERVLGRSLDGDLPPRLGSLMLLLSADNVDFDAVRELLEDVLAGRDLARREANARWLDAMANRGMDVDRWIRGVDVELEVAGEPLRVQTEFDPLHVLEMGSYFDTCLSLEGGFNAASTLTNAIDVNKQALYGRRRDGTVVARKLIAVTDDGVLLGYRTYAFENQARVDALLSSALAEFAEACGVRPGVTGQPRALHGTFWYDDGVVPWRVRPGVGLPEDIPGDTAGVAEYAYWQGFDDPAWWRWGATLDEHDWGPICAARAFDGAHASDLPHDARVFLATRGRFDWLAGGEVHPYDDLRDIAGVLPAEPQAARSFVDAIRVARGATPRRWAELAEVPRGLAVLTVSEVASYIVDHIRLARQLEVECFVEHHSDCIMSFVRQAADVLQASWVRGGAGEIDRLFAARDPVTRQVGIEIAQRVVSPDIARRLRALHKSEGPVAELVWALGRQGDDASIWALRSALDADPSNLEIVAALEFFAPDEAVAAREIMELPTKLPAPGLARDLALPSVWRGPPAALAAGGLELMDPQHRDAFELAKALRGSNGETNAVWAEYVRARPTESLFAPSRSEALRLLDGLFVPDPDAVSYALRRYWHGRLDLAATALDGDRLAALWPCIDITTYDHQLTMMRTLLRRVPADVDLVKIGRLQEDWCASRALGTDADLWRRYLHALVDHGDARVAMSLANVMARNVEASEFDVIVGNLWAAHEKTFVADAMAIVERLVTDWPSDFGSYRLLDAFIRWVAPRTDAHPAEFVSGRLRGDWVVERWRHAVSAGSNSP